MKVERYEALLPQIKNLVEGETDAVGVMANVAAALHEAMGFFWTGFYRVTGEEELCLGPFQGSVACYRIRKGRGVCGTAWLKEETQVVEDVEQFPGHIACSSLSRSEIVVPIFSGGTVKAVLDIDSDRLAAFDAVDKKYLERVAGMLSHLFCESKTFD